MNSSVVLPAVSRPLVIDLDGTLLRSDLLVESVFSHARLHPWKALSPFGWLASGKANLKEQLAKTVGLDVASLPYDLEVIAFIKEERSKGRQIILATATHLIYAQQIAEHLQLFDRVMATQGVTNLSAVAKRDALVGEFGEKGFDYAGNSLDDLPIWAAANRAYLVNPEPGVERKARAYGNIESVMRRSSNKVRIWAKALRLHQWTKNLLIFVPLLASHQLSDLSLLVNGLLAFFFFGLCASSVYLLNDLLDLADDRRHPSKRHRPFASGTLSVKAGLLGFPLLLAAAFGGALWLLPWTFSSALVIYYGLTLCYSLILRREMVVDVVTLAILYTMRIVAGALAFGLVLTFWMLAFSMFIFLSLALVKRYGELYDERLRGETKKTGGRGYYPADLEMIASLGAASGYLSVMVLALYIQDRSTTVLYRYPEVIWLACPLLLFWITRVWMLAHRGEMHDDPVVFAVKDRASLFVGALFGCVFWFAT